MCLAEDLGIEICYQDTDSMHIEHDKIELLNKTFSERYGRELIADNKWANSTFPGNYFKINTLAQHYFKNRLLAQYYF